VTVGPNSLGTYSIDIPIAEFRDSTAGATTSYRMQITIIDQGGGGVVDYESIVFAIGPYDPLNGNWSLTITRLSTTSPTNSWLIDEGTFNLITTVKSSDIIYLYSEEDEEGYDVTLDRISGSNSFRIYFDWGDGNGFDMECEFLSNNYSRFEGILTSDGYEYLTHQDLIDDVRTYYTCTSKIVGIRK